MLDAAPNGASRLSHCRCYKDFAPPELFFKPAGAERVHRFRVPPRLLTFANTFSKIAHASGTLKAKVPHR